MLHEHDDFMNKTRLETLKTALAAFTDHTGVKTEFTAAVDHGWDAAAFLYFDPDKPERFFVEVKREVRNHHLQQLLKYKDADDPIMVIAEYILPKTKEALQENNICYLETNGNTYLKRLPKYFLWIEIKTQQAKEFTREVNRAFTKTGLKVVFLLLMDEMFVGQTYRAIAKAADVGLGNVNNIVRGLKELRLLIQKNDRELLLPDKKALLDRWIPAYEQRLKPTLHIGNFRFADKNAFFNWRNLHLEQQTVWGGEPAGDLYTDNLNPETLVLYTNETRGELMKNYRLVPDDDGNVEAYKKFWNINTPNIIYNAVPPLLAYTDLINTGTQRNLETATKLYEKYLKNKLG
jgi:hypothetical protein